MGYPPNSSSDPSPVSRRLTPTSWIRRNSGADTTVLMMSPYSVSSPSRIASRTWANRMSDGRSGITSCGTPRAAQSRRGAAGRRGGGRGEVRVHLAELGQRDRAVQAAGEDDADGQVGVDPHPDAVDQG